MSIFLAAADVVNSGRYFIIFINLDLKVAILKKKILPLGKLSWELESIFEYWVKRFLHR